MQTIFALSSGQPPAGIAVIRISGDAAGRALDELTGSRPPARRATLRQLRRPDGVLLDVALTLWFPGPATATGEDLAELHLHGGRAVVAAVKDALRGIDGVREAEPGEFTRRAFANGRIDLAEAEGLADLLAAETELQRSIALALAGGALSRQTAEWRVEVLKLGAVVEAVLDFADEDDVATLPPAFAEAIADMGRSLTQWLARPRAEALREGFRVVLAGPPNAGKSTLFNALVETDAAITAAIPGTTRDALVRPVALSGVPFTFVDTAGMHDAPADAVEAIGIGRARRELEKAELVLWLGTEGLGPIGCWEIDAQCDRARRIVKRLPRHRLSALTGEGIDGLRRDLADHARQAMPALGEVALNERQHRLVTEAELALRTAASERDPLLIAEGLRLARQAFDRLTGQASTEDMLDTLFGRFCIGK